LERETIENRLKSEKERAEEELYAQIDEKSTFKTQNKEKAIKQEASDDELEDVITTKKETRKQQDSSDIFNSGDVAYAEEDVPEQKLPKKEDRVVPNEPRKAGSVKVKFTEKMYPHLAAREQHLKEPPLPKTTQIQKTGDVRNFLRKGVFNEIG